MREHVVHLAGDARSLGYPRLLLVQLLVGLGSQGSLAQGQQQLSPVKVKKKSRITELRLGSGVGTKDLVTFTRLFATMIDAGLPLVQCLEILSNQQPNKTFAVVLKDVKLADRVRPGDSMEVLPRFF